LALSRGSRTPPAVQQRQRRLQDARRSPPRLDLNGIAQSDAHGIELDLHAARLTGLQMNSMYGNDVPTIKSVSHSSIVSCDSRVPRSPMDPLVSAV
jgi:hypothetical protein